MVSLCGAILGPFRWDRNDNKRLRRVNPVLYFGIWHSFFELKTAPKQAVLALQF